MYKFLGIVSAAGLSLKDILVPFVKEELNQRMKNVNFIGDYPSNS